MGQDRQPPAGDDSEASEREASPDDFSQPLFAATVRGHAPFTPETTPPLIPNSPPTGSVVDTGADADASPWPSRPIESSAVATDGLNPDQVTLPGEELASRGLAEEAVEPPAEELAAETERQEEARKKRTRTIVRELVETGLLALLVFLAVRASLQNFKVDGNSMFPTLHNGQFLIVNKLVYAEIDTKTLGKALPFLDSGTSSKRNVFHAPQRGDIVVLVDPQRSTTDLVKRIIGLPGDSLEILDGKVYINGQLLIEPYIKAAWHDTKPKVDIPAGEYFVMGDNRDNSLDSRSPQVGLVPADLIIGKAMLSYWPTERFGLAPNGTPTLSPQDTIPPVSSR